jgi:hypothetical protein
MTIKNNIIFIYKIHFKLINFLTIKDNLVNLFFLSQRLFLKIKIKSKF